MATPYVTIIVDEVSSTQDLAAKELQGSDLPVLIVASRQTAGRGRYGNEWWQAPRAVSASFAFPSDLLATTASFSLAVGLAVRSAIGMTARVELALKWPNDLEVDGGKAGGILIERSDVQTVVGCGLNLWWPEPPAGVSAVFDLDPGAAVGAEISRGWVEALLAGGGRWDRELYKSASSTLGEELTWDPEGRGTAVDIDDEGGLVVLTGSGEVTLRSGEVRRVRRASGDA